MRIAYADPPYIGQAKKFYAREEVDHLGLIEILSTDFKDGWALSCSSNTLRHLLPACPDGVRVAAWVKPFAFFKKGVAPAYCWEPVIFWGGRAVGTKRGEKTARDWVSCNAWGTTAVERKDPLKGRKPRAFAEWLFTLMGLQAGDEFVELFPGSGAMSEWFKQRSQMAP